MIIVTGAASGLGLEIFLALAKRRTENVIGFDKKWDQDVCDPGRTFGDPPEGLTTLINCAGLNRPEWLVGIRDFDWDAVMDVNCKGIFKMSQWALPLLQEAKGTIVNIVSSAADVPMRCSAAYNASKAAAAMLTRQMARELAPDVTVFGISPNKLAGTPMSRQVETKVEELRGWTAEQAEAYQRAALLPGVETPPQRVAEFLAFLLSEKERHRHLAGSIIPYGV
jgi:NAD(P)-dependent dehydrogenase (short-subunit alcohol dehydrogenase family)